MALLALKLFNLHATYLASSLHRLCSLRGKRRTSQRWLVLTILWRWGQQAGSKRAHVRGALALFSGLHAIRSIVTSAVHFCSIIFCQGLSVFFEMSVLEGARRRQGCAHELELLDDGNYVFTLPTSSNRLPSCLVRAHGVRYYTLPVAMVVLASSVYEVFHAVVGDPFFGKRR